MSLFLMDTDTLTLMEHGQPQVLANVNSHPVAEVSVSAISIQEQMKGFLAAAARVRDHKQLASAYNMLVTRLLPASSRFPVLSFSEQAIARFEQLRSMRLNVGMMDLRIASIALENGLTVATRNQCDFGRVPGLVTVDWSV